MGAKQLEAFAYQVKRLWTNIKKVLPTHGPINFTGLNDLKNSWTEQLKAQKLKKRYVQCKKSS